MSSQATTPAQLQPLVDELNAWLGERFDRLEQLGQRFVSTLRFDQDGLLELTESARRSMKSAAAAFLEENSVVDGGGVIFARSALGTENGHLEWWVREDESRFARYSFGVVPGADRYYDYEHHEWFVRAFHEGVPAMVGPYIDYLGVESYVLTLTVPAVLDGQRIGAIGNDIELADFEKTLLPALLAHDEPLALIGKHGNVLCSNTEKLLPGTYAAPGTPHTQYVTLTPATAGVQLIITEG